MNYKHKKASFLIIVLMLLSFTFVNVQFAGGYPSIEVDASGIPESEDFATLILRDPWDMDQFTDISQYLNESGQREIIRNPSVSGGIFSGTAVGGVAEGNNGNFFPLFPGYETAMLIGKVGHRYPINAAQYHCLYVAMKVNSPQDGFVPDRYRVFFFANEMLNVVDRGGIYGSTYPIRLFEPDTAPPAGVNIWKLHKVDLSKPPEGFAPGTATWNDQASWQGLRIDPTMNADTFFAVDWVRLTKCESNLQTITWTPNSSLSTMWLRPVGTSRNIRVATDVVGQSGSYQLDMQGIAPGNYVVGLSNSLSDCCIVESNEILEINQTPIADFADPNFYSGPDYATLAGNPWDFLDSADVVKLAGVQGNLVDGVLDLVTLKSNGADPKVYLNTPQLIQNSKEYRYFTFRMYTEGPWQNVTDGMILRWIWVQLNSQGDECYRVSHDIPYDVGWQTYSIDLHDAFNGIAEEVAGSCSGKSWHWLDSSPLSKFRLDPNENVLGIPLHQQLDWVRLTKAESVQQGTQFTIRIGLNKSPGEMRSIEFFYTDNANLPTQHPANEFQVVSNQSNIGESQSADFGQTLQFPFLVRNLVSSDLPIVSNEVEFNWDTSNVASGEYNICVRLNDGLNQAMYCSEATIRVVSN